MENEMENSMETGGICRTVIFEPSENQKCNQSSAQVRTGVADLRIAHLKILWEAWVTLIELPGALST